MKQVKSFLSFAEEGAIWSVVIAFGIVSIVTCVTYFTARFVRALIPTVINELKGAFVTTG